MNDVGEQAPRKTKRSAQRQEFTAALVGQVIRSRTPAPAADVLKAIWELLDSELIDPQSGLVREEFSTPKALSSRKTHAKLRELGLGKAERRALVQLVDARRDGVPISPEQVSAALAEMESQPPWDPTTDLSAQRQCFTSQNNEDGMLHALFRRIGTTDKRAVEIACGTNGGNAGWLVAGLGFHGLFVEGGARRANLCRASFAGYPVNVVKDWITTERINALLSEHGFDGELDYFGLDLDGNDYWIWKAMTVTRPRVMVTEYNSVFPPDRAVTIEYNPTHTFRFDDTPASGYFGASLAALALLAVRKGYRLIATDENGVNAFWLRNDVAPDIPGRAVAEVWRPCTKGRYNRIRKAMAGEDVVAFFAQHNLPLIEVT